MNEVTPDVRQMAVRQLHDLVKHKKLHKSPEEVEEMIFGKSRGSRDVYLNMLEKLKHYPAPNHQVNQGQMARSPLNQGPAMIQRNNSIPQNFYYPHSSLHQPVNLLQAQEDLGLLNPYQFNNIQGQMMTQMPGNNPQHNFHMNQNPNAMQINQPQHRMNMINNARPNPVQTPTQQRPTQQMMPQRPQIGNQVVRGAGGIPNNIVVSGQQMMGNRMMNQNQVMMSNRMPNMYQSHPNQMQPHSIMMNPYDMMNQPQQKPPGQAFIQNVPPVQSGPQSTNPIPIRMGGPIQSIPQQRAPMTQEEEKIVESLRRLAQKYLPAVQQAYLIVREHPQGNDSVLRKYAKLKEILEKPEMAYAPLKFNQISKIETLLDDVEKNPLHLLNQALKLPQKSGQNKPPGPPIVTRDQSGNIIQQPPPPPVFFDPTRIHRPQIPFSGVGPGPGFNPANQQPQNHEMVQMQFHKQAVQNRIANLQQLIIEMDAMADSERKDPVYSEQVSRAVQEIYFETKPFRELHGIQISQDILATILENEPNIEQESLGNPISDLTTSEMGLDNEELGKSDPDQDSSKAMKRKQEENMEEEQELDLFPANGKGIDQVKVLIQSPLDVCEAMTKFPWDLMRQLNRIVKDEICQVTKKTSGLIIVKGVVNPPEWKVMETQQTCMSPSEWNNSFHLSLVYTKKDENSFLIPELYVRLAPSYLRNRKLTMWFDKRTLLKEPVVKKDEDDINSGYCEPEKKFGEFFLAEAEQKLSLLQRFFAGRMTLMMIGQAWLDAIQSASRRVQFEF